MKAAALIFLGLVALASAAERKSYSGYQVLRVQVENEAQGHILSALEKRNVFDFWSHIRTQGPVDIMASPETLLALETYLIENNLSFSVMIDDVQKVAEMAPMKPAGSTNSKQGHNMDWDSYHPLEDMYGYFDYLEANYDYVSSEIIGQSLEGRDMRILKLCKGGCGNKPAMYIDGGIHAREWIAPATVTFFINELTENLSGQEDLIDELDWYFLPSANPDGYQYSQDSDRMWRKTRSYHDGDLCIGTDANRNWDWHFDDGGASDSSCSDSYHGPYPFSEIEDVNVRDFMLAHNDKIKFVDSMHSYSQLILIPWGYTTTPTPNFDDMFAMATKGNEALYAVHGKSYEVGCVPCILYIASGLTLDWAHGGAEVKYTFSMELRDQGRYGFLLPEDEIIPTGEEAWAFHKSAARDIITEFA